MPSTSRSICCTLALILAMTVQGASQAPSSRVTVLTAEERDARERGLTSRRAADNGISVDQVKIYDDSMLQQMLRAAESKLAAMQTLDQSSVISRFGALTGATQRISNVGVGVQTPQIPGVTSTSRSGGTTSVNTVTDAISATGVATSSEVDQSTIASSTQDVVSAAPAFAPPTATPPAATTSLPGAFSVSASDALNEQMQLTYEIANLRLLLDGALSDHVMVVDGARYVKPRVTLGFPIAVDSQNRFRDATAVVEVEVSGAGHLASERPSITALLPRDRTYNVAAITDSSMSIGGGIATGVVGVSGSWLRGRKTYFITQDQDTVALSFEPDAADAVGIRWQFRPVLGKRVIKSGLRQTFVQIAFPLELDPAIFGHVKVRTYWVRYDAKRGSTKDVVRGSYKEYDVQPIVPLPLASEPTAFNNSHLEDLGAGQMLVNVKGRFLSGSYVRIGNAALTEGAGARFEHGGVRFTASIADLATKRTVMVARDGSERPLAMALARDGGGPVAVEAPVSATARITGLDDGNVELIVEMDRDVEKIRPRPLLVLGPRAFGYSDAPVERAGRRLTAVVPASLVMAHPRVTVTSLFADYRVEAPIEGLTSLSRAERIVLLEQGTSSSRFLLYGSRLGAITVLEPEGATLGTMGRSSDSDTLRSLTLRVDQMKLKHLVLQRPNERPFLLPMPPADKPPTARARERVGLDSDVATFELDVAVEAAPTASWAGTALTVIKVDGRTLRVTGLKKAGVTASVSTQSIEFVFATGKSTASLEIISGRIESIAR